ncbi:MAG: hypothetical protein HFF38_04630 [Lawsonibacter sp.]|nr:hypothetical protein [Lawsonibacter sp.]
MIKQEWGKGSGNDAHIAFVICEDGLTGPAYFQAVYQKAMELTAMLCREYSLEYSHRCTSKQARFPRLVLEYSFEWEV